MKPYPDPTLLENRISTRLSNPDLYIIFLRRTVTGYGSGYDHGSASSRGGNSQVGKIKFNVKTVEVKDITTIERRLQAFSVL